MAALLDAPRIEEYAPGRELVVEGEPAPDWYCVLETGAVQISRLDVESEEILDYLTAGRRARSGHAGTAGRLLSPGTEREPLPARPAVGRGPSPRRLASGPAGDYRGEIALFVHRVADLVKGPPLTCGPDTSVAEAARLMTSHGRRLGRGGGSRWRTDRHRDRSRPARRWLPTASRRPPPWRTSCRRRSCPSTRRRPAFDALLEMTRRGIHHLGVVDDGRLVGVVSSHDLILLQGAHPVALMRDIDAQGTIEGLRAVASRVHAVVTWLAEHGASAYDIGRIVAELNDRSWSARCPSCSPALLAEGHEPPLPYTWLAAGSEGRREQTLKTDQDNGLVYPDPPRSWPRPSPPFSAVSRAACTMRWSRWVSPCAGGFMASNPRWCQPESVWRGYFESWMETPLPAQLLRASIFFDLRPVAGDEPPGRVSATGSPIAPRLTRSSRGTWRGSPSSGMCRWASSAGSSSSDRARTRTSSTSRRAACFP